MLAELERGLKRGDHGRLSGGIVLVKVTQPVYGSHALGDGRKRVWVRVV